MGSSGGGGGGDGDDSGEGAFGGGSGDGVLSLRRMMISSFSQSFGGGVRGLRTTHSSSFLAMRLPRLAGRGGGRLWLVSRMSISSLTTSRPRPWRDGDRRCSRKVNSSLSTSVRGGGGPRSTTDRAREGGGGELCSWMSMSISVLSTSLRGGGRSPPPRLKRISSTGGGLRGGGGRLSSRRMLMSISSFSLSSRGGGRDRVRLR